MTEKYYPPSIDPASKGDFAGIIRFILTKWLQKTDDMLPAIVVSYDRATNRAKVQPIISIVTTSNEVVKRGVIASVPVLQLGGGGFVLSFPINPGDLGWIKANDRDISLFLQSLQNSPPNTARLHSFENGMFIPDTMFKSVTINAEDAENVVLQNLDGTVRIALFSDKIKMTAPTIEMVAATEIVLHSPLTTITGVLESGTAAGGAASFGGTVTAVGDVIGAGKSLDTHVHSGVQPGGGNTGPPV